MDCHQIAGSSNGRTTPFGGVCRGSNPLPAAKKLKMVIDFKGDEVEAQKN